MPPTNAAAVEERSRIAVDLTVMDFFSVLCFGLNPSFGPSLCVRRPIVRAAVGIPPDAAKADMAHGAVDHLRWRAAGR